MEVVGLVAAIPGLIDLVKHTKTIVQGFIDRKIFLKETTNLLVQLDLISQILVDIQGRWDPTSFRRFNLNHLPPAVASLKNDLESLKSLLATNIPVRNRSLLLKQAMLAISGFESKVKHHTERLEKTKSLLMLVILARGDEVAEESLSTTRTNLRLELKNLLRPCDHNFIPPNLSGTCEWIWTHPVLSCWLNRGTTTSGSFGDRVMSIYGTKGCGKSVLAVSIAERLRAQGKVASLFSFWAGKESQRKLTDFLRTFLWHLLQHVPDKDIQTIYTPMVKDLPFNQFNLGHAIKNTGALINSTIYCILDAIDESADDWSQSKDGSLEYVLQLVRAMPNLRLILLGREPAMQAAKASTTLNVEITEDIVRNDIQRFIDAKLDHSLKVQTPAIKQLVRQFFQERSTTMFLWVSLVFTELNRCYLASEIERTLEHTPHDLDREYHRLFAQLISRLGGNLTRPSIFLQRTKCLLSLIIAASEPLTCDELRHAFALCQHPQSGFEEYLIEPEGIINSVGDFVRISNGRFHIAHASLIEFLSRNLEDWMIDDEPIIFFRIDIAEAHVSMCLACFDYLLQTDLGYPMTDNSPSNLLSSLVFFAYVSKEIPKHVMEIFTAGLSSRIEPKLREFFESTQFCRFIEYLSFCFQHDDWSLVYSYSMVWHNFIMSKEDENKIEFPPGLPNLEQLFANELRRRETEFGLNHSRCQSWQSLVKVVLGSWIVEPQQVFQDSSGDETIDPNTEESNSREIVVEVATGPISKLPRHLLANHRIPLQGVSRFVHSIVRHVYRVPTAFSALSADALPTSFLLLWSLQVSEPSQAIHLVSVALKRVTGQGGFTEGLCLLHLGFLLKEENSQDEDVGKFLRRGLEITTNLPPLPHVEWLTANIMINLAEYLDGCKKEAESLQILQQLKERLLGTVSPTSLHVFPGKILWNEFKTNLLYRMVECYHSNGDYQESYRLADHIINHQEKLTKTTVDLSDALMLKAQSLYCMDEFLSSEEVYRKMLHTLQTLGQNREFDRKWYGIDGIFACLYMQGKDIEAVHWIEQIDLNMPVDEELVETGHMASWISDGCESIWNIGRISTLLKEYGLAKKFFHRALLECDSLSEETAGPPFMNLTALAETLEEYRPTFKVKDDVLDCCRLLAMWDEDTDYPDNLNWWQLLARDVRNEDYDYFDIDAWDIIFLKCIDICIEKYNMLSDEILRLYLALVSRYEQDEEHEAAAIVLQDFIHRHTAASRKVSASEFPRTEHENGWSPGWSHLKAYPSCQEIPDLNSATF